MKSLVLLFGEMGSGKSYLGKLIAKERGLDYVEGDDFVPDDMTAAVAKFKPPTEQMIRTLVENIKIKGTAAGLMSDSGVVISQALYREEHRVELITYWEVLGFKVEPYWIRPGWLQNIRQLYRRRKGLRWVVYWLLSKPWFQKPKHKHTINKNNV